MRAGAKPVTPEETNRLNKIQRRRTLSATMPLPFRWYAHWTVGQRAVLAIVGRNANRNGGVCDLVTDRIAKLSGTSVSTVKATLRDAQRYGLVSIERHKRVGQVNCPNWVRIVDPEWREWLSLGLYGRMDRTENEYNRTRRFG